MTELTKEEMMNFISELEGMKVRIEEILQEMIGEEKARMKIERCLKSLGMSLNLKGYIYVAEAIEMWLESEDILLKEIYYSIAKKHNTSWNCVEKNMRSSIKKVMLKGNKTLLSKIFQNFDKPTVNNGKFIKTIGNYIKYNF